MKKVYVRKNRYVDSVTLMGVAERLHGLAGVAGAECGMATAANVDLLTSLGYPVPDDATPNDLMIAIDADAGDQPRAYQAGLDMLEHRGGRAERVYHDVDAIDLAQDPYDLV